MTKASAAKIGSSLVARKLMRGPVKAGDAGLAGRRDGQIDKPHHHSAGRDAIGMDKIQKIDRPVSNNGKSSKLVAAPLAGVAPRTGTKQALIVEMLSKEGGATLDALIERPAGCPYDARGADGVAQERLCDRTHRRGREGPLRLLGRSRHESRGLTNERRSSSGQSAADHRVGTGNLGTRSRRWKASIWTSCVAAGAACWVDRRRPICREVFSCAFSPIGIKSRGSETSIARLGLLWVRRWAIQNFWAGGAAGGAPSGKASVALRPGTVLDREYEAVIHRVTVTVGGCSWNGREFRSLSEVALAITGTKWNGPRFFGLRSEKKVEKPRGGNLVSTTAAAEVGS